MRAPSAEELAAIAAAFFAVTRSEPGDGGPAEAPRWRLAGRLPALDVQRARFASRSASRWNAASRLDG